jgi:hypothetical protein
MKNAAGMFVVVPLLSSALPENSSAIMLAPTVVLFFILL